MKTYKVKIAWEGINVGDIMHTVIGEPGRLQCNNVELTGFATLVALHLGFIEEVGAVKKKFVPNFREIYFYIDSTGIVQKTKNEKFIADEMYISIGNCYRTEAEALEARERVLKAY